MFLQGSRKSKIQPEEDEANRGLSQWDANLTPTWNTSITQTLSLSQPQQKKNFVYPQFPLFSPSSLTSLQSLWLISADRRPVGSESWKERKVEGKTVHPRKNFSSKSAGATPFPRGGRGGGGGVGLFSSRAPRRCAEGRCGCYMCPGFER